MPPKRARAHFVELSQIRRTFEQRREEIRRRRDARMFRNNPRGALAVEEDALMRGVRTGAQAIGRFVAGPVAQAAAAAGAQATAAAGRAVERVPELARAAGEALREPMAQAAATAGQVGRVARETIDTGYRRLVDYADERRRRYEEDRERRDFVREREGPDARPGFEGRVMQNPLVEELRQQRLARDADTARRIEDGRQRAIVLEREYRERQAELGRRAEEGRLRGVEMARAAAAERHAERLAAFHRGRDAVRAQADRENLERIRADLRASARSRARRAPPSAPAAPPPPPPPPVAPAPSSGAQGALPPSDIDDYAADIRRLGDL